MPLRVGWLAAVIAAAGCTLGPDYEAPTIDWVDEWETDLYAEIGSPEDHADFDLRFWWRLFDDPVLNQLIELAKTENPSLRSAGLRVLEARAALGLARGFRYPQLQQINADALYINTRRSGRSTDDFTPTASFDVGWEIDFWGRFARGIESADAAFFGSIANQQDVQVLLAAQVADLYFTYRVTRQRIAIAESNAENQRRSFEITRELYESGQQAELDLQQAKSQYMATLSVIPALESSLRQLRNAISALVARPPGGLPELDDELQDLPMVDPAVVDRIPAELLIRRPDVRAAAAQVAAQSSRIGIAEAAKYPMIRLLGTVGYADSTMNLGVGPSLTWDIFNYGRLSNQVRIEDARLQQALENFQFVALAAVQEIDDAAISVVKTREQREPQEQSTQAAERSLELANSRYQEGYASFQRVIDAQRDAATQRDRRLVIINDHLSAIVAFYKAVGGGWHEATMEELVPEETREIMEGRTDWSDLLRDPVPPEADFETTRTEPETVSNDE